MKDKMDIEQDAKKALKAEAKQLVKEMDEGQEVTNNKKTNKKRTSEEQEDYIKYLSSLYKNITTALHSIEELQPKVEFEDLKKELSNQLTNYDIIARECEMIAKSENFDLKDNNLLEKIRLWGAININTLADNSTRHIAEMMILGTITSIIQCLKDLKDFKNVCPDLDDLCQKIIEVEEKNYQKLKIFI
jgi:hypothetical protein